MRTTRTREGASFFAGIYFLAAIAMLSYAVYVWLTSGLRYPVASLLACITLAPLLLGGILAEAIRVLAGRSFQHITDRFQGGYFVLFLLGNLISLLTVVFATGLMFLTWESVVRVAFALGVSNTVQFAIGLGWLAIATLFFVSVLMRLISRSVSRREN